MAPTKEFTYTYTKINELQVGLNFNVYGILVDVIKESERTLSGQLYSLYTIRDESLPPNEVFRMHSFSRTVPVPNLTVGDIIRFHRVKVETCWNNLDGRVFNANDIVSFSKDAATNYTFTSAARAITLTAKDKERISELREVAILDYLFLSSQDSSTNESMMVNALNNKANTSPKPVVNQSIPSNEENERENLEVQSQILGLSVVNTSRDLVLNPFNKSVKEIIHKVKHNSSDVQNGSKSPSPGKKLCTEARSSPVVSSQRRKVSECDNVQEHTQSPSPGKKLCTEARSSPVVSSQRRKVSECDNVQEHMQSPSPGKKLCTEAQASSQRRRVSECANVEEPMQSSCLSQAESSSTCPGILCANDKCGESPILLAPGIKIPPADAEGGIPAADEEGNVFLQKPYKFPVKETIVTNGENFINNFKWPRFSVQVTILKTKPSLRVLESDGPKNLLSGSCRACGHFTFYSKLKWKVNQELSSKRPVCPICLKTEMFIEMRLQLTLVDRLGKQLQVYVIREEACKFLGCKSLKEYQTSEECRLRTVRLLSESLLSSQFLGIRIYCVNTPVGKQFYVYDSNLSQLLQDPCS